MASYQGSAPSLSVVQYVFGNGFTSITQGFWSGHGGIDLAAPINTPVNNIVSGNVIYAENASSNVSKAFQFGVNSQNGSKSGGNSVIIQAADGTRYYYEHLNTIGVSVGQYVNAGSMIGGVGQTGDATGPHLHFAMSDSNQNWIDPTVFLSKFYLNYIESSGGSPAAKTGALGSGGTTANIASNSSGLIPDIPGAVVFLGILLVGITFIILAGLVSKNFKGD